MTDVLARIVGRKREEVAGRLGGRPVDAEPTRRSLRAALGRPGARFIMEVKRASPSGHRSSVTVERAVAAYTPVADAISILADGPDFGGSLDDIRTARTRFDGPILAKDFIVDAALVSRVHCRLTAGAAELEVLDLESTNGTFVNGARVDRALLRAGDKLGIGKVEFAVSRANSSVTPSTEPSAT